MKNFKEYLAEVWGSKKTKDLVFMNIDDSDLALPISKKMFDRLMGERKHIRAVHITDFDGFEDLIALQKSRKQIAAMTYLADSAIHSIRDGIARAGGMAVVLKGYPVLSSDFDLHSLVDEQGRRWIMLSNITMSKGFDQLWKGMKIRLQDVRDEILYELEKKFGGSPPFWEFLHIPLESEEWEEFQDELKRADEKNPMKRKSTMRKLQGYAIKRYMDKVEKQVWKPNLNALQSILEPVVDQNTRSSWNEVSLVDTEIKEVHILRVDVLKYAEETWGIDVNDPDEFEVIQEFDEDMNQIYNRYKLAGYDKKFKSIYVDSEYTGGLGRDAKYHFQQLFVDVNLFNS